MCNPAGSVREAIEAIIREYPQEAGKMTTEQKEHLVTMFKGHLSALRSMTPRDKKGLVSLFLDNPITEQRLSPRDTASVKESLMDYWGAHMGDFLRGQEVTHKGSSRVIYDAQAVWSSPSMAFYILTDPKITRMWSSVPPMEIEGRRGLRKLPSRYPWETAKQAAQRETWEAWRGSRPNPAGSAEERKLSPQERKGFAEAMRYTYGEQQGEFTAGQQVKHAGSPYLVLEVSETAPSGEHFYTLVSPGMDKVLPTVPGEAIEGRRIRGRRRSPWSLWGRSNPATKGKKKMASTVKVRVRSAEDNAVPAGTYSLAQARALFLHAPAPSRGYSKVDYQLLKGRKVIFSGRIDISRDLTVQERNPISHARNAAEWVLSPKGRDFYRIYGREKEYVGVSAGAKALLRELKGV